VQSAIGHVDADHSNACAVVHNQVEQKLLHEEVAVLAKSTSEEGVQHGVSCPVRHTAGALGLASFALLQGLPSEGPLVDLAFFSAGKGESLTLEFLHHLGSFPAHVMDGVLVS